MKREDTFFTQCCCLNEHIQRATHTNTHIDAILSMPAGSEHFCYSASRQSDNHTHISQWLAWYVVLIFTLMVFFTHSSYIYLTTPVCIFYPICMICCLTLFAFLMWSNNCTVYKLKCITSWRVLVAQWYKEKEVDGSYTGLIKMTCLLWAQSMIFN